MTQEIKTKKNTDYSASAVNLCNPPDIEASLTELALLTKQQEDIKAKIDALVPPGLRDELAQATVNIVQTKATIESWMDIKGSYQDLTKGWYAVKQRKVSKSYNAESFEKTYPQFAPAVIVKAVDTTKLTGLIKGGLLDEARLEADGVLKLSESFSYIIRI